MQGVFFRGATQEEARSQGVDGWVRNQRDGSVEAVFEGAAEAVEAMVRFCRRGPPGSRVVHLEVTEETPEALRGFEVRF